MGIRKKGGYYSSDEEEPGDALPPPKRPKFAPLRLTAPAFKLPGAGRAQTPSSRAQTPSSRSATPSSHPSIPSVTPGQRTIAQSTLRTSFPTPRNTSGVESNTVKADAAPGKTSTTWDTTERE